MAKKNNKKQKRSKAKKTEGLQVVNFLAGLKTPQTGDDRQVRFLARGSNPLQAPKEMMEGIPLRPKIPVRQAEFGGLQFDKAFGLGEKSENPFSSKIGIDPNFGLGSFDTEFTKGFVNQEFDFGESTLISDDFDEPSEDNFVNTNEKVPSLLDSLPTLGEKIPLTDEEADRKNKVKRAREVVTDSGFENVRAKQLLAGDKALTPTEEFNFQQGKAFRGQIGGL